jgi:MFS family permease
LIGAAVCYTAFSVGTALAPHIGALFAFRILTGLSSTALLTIGNTCIGDVYHPTQRGTAGGWILLGFELGPTLGRKSLYTSRLPTTAIIIELSRSPAFIGGVMVTYRSWRTLFYFQAALGAFFAVLYVGLLLETAPYLGHRAFANANLTSRVHLTVRELNPLRVVALLRFRPILAAGIASGALMWNMYSLITPITYVLNPRFGITSPILSGLFFLAPGVGYILGALLGGRWADYTVKVYMRRRQGLLLPEDRLKSCLPFVGIVAPVSTILYGWSVQYEFGGMALPVVMLFLQAVAQLFGFLAINPYCLDVMQSHGRSADVIAGNYFIRYMFGAAGIAAALPVITSVGVGWLSTISAIFLLLSTVFLIVITRVNL